MKLTRKILLVAGAGTDHIPALRLALASPDIELTGIVLGGPGQSEAVNLTRQVLESAEKSALPLATAGEGAGLIAGQADLYKDELTLVVVGPLTELAKALERDKELPEKFAAVIVKGGAIRVPGNVTQIAEANMHADPEAAALVLASGLPLLLVPLDAAERVCMQLEGGDGLDAFAAMMAAIHPELAEKQTMKLSVECQSELSRGALIADLRAIPRVGVDTEVCLNIQAEPVATRAKEVMGTGDVR
ncbi:nucleoside hydrolase [Brevibacillus borstelensis]|uniref:nucleoside hydrolase n=1 Tax=Brevibacillus borstelensis TaxID=45462 RepID=UPI0030C1647A